MYFDLKSQNKVCTKKDKFLSTVPILLEGSLSVYLHLIDT